mgnify:CR=1 FL=1
MGAGHPPNIKDVQHMEKLWQDFKNNLEEQAEKWLKVQYVGKEGERVTDAQKLPLTFEGFKAYCHDIGIGTVEQYFTNQDDYYDKYIGVCSRIKNEIRNDQIVGGLLGFWNSSITQRLNGLTDKQEIKTDQPTEIKVTVVKGKKK